MQTSAQTDQDPIPLGRLPSGARPTHYELEVQIVPERQRFSGTARIEVQLDAPLQLVWLHGRELAVRRVSVGRDGDAERLDGVWDQVHPDGVVALRLPRPVGPGPVSLQVEYDAAFDEQLEGLYRIDAGGEAYAFTQFQSISARLAFPCFDEPGFKTPFDVTLVVPAGHTVIATTLPVAEAAAPDGLKRVRFARTAPLPTYLLAWAVGPFDVVEAPPIPPSAVRQAAVPFRGVSVRGRGVELAYALEHTPAQLEALEDYFGIAYPYDKLDVIAVPDFAAGAMENVGAVTFREQLLLLDADRAPEEQRRRFADVMAHELAHMWFGNLVTLSWWDDTWLNEAFASWMASRVIQTLYPEYRYEAWMQRSIHAAMQLDSLTSARPIRQPVRTHHDIEDSFDEITYEKGMALLTMFERWVGEDAFRRGVRLYLERHRFGNATEADLLAALAELGGRDVAGPLHTFLVQPGVPLVQVGVRPDGEAYSLELSQSRFLPVGSAGSRQACWQVPVCLRYGDGQKTLERSVLLERPQARIDLDVEAAPAWILPNAGASGYYRWSLEPAELSRLLRCGWPHLSALERLAVADGLVAGFESATLAAETLLAELPTLAADADRFVATTPMPLLRFALEELVPAALRPSVEGYARRLYLPLCERLGWEADPGGGPEDGETKLLRREVLEFLALLAREPLVRAEAARRGRRYLGLDGGGGGLHPEAVSADLAEVCLAVAVQDGEDSVFEAVLERLHACDVALVRDWLLRALASSHSASLAARVRDLALDPRLRVNEVFVPLERQREQPWTREDLWPWLQRHFDAVVQRVGHLRAGWLPRLVDRTSDPARAAQLADFFRPRIDQLVGGPRNLATAIESIELRAARITAHADGARRFFQDLTPTAPGHADRPREPSLASRPIPKHGGELQP